jgi:serine/threonine-protein kinase
MTQPDDDEPVRALDLLADRYRILEPVAGGGTATVWRARDEWLSRPVAVKVMRPSHPASEPTRLIDEASLLAQLSHPHVTAVYDIGMTNGVPFLVMELVNGEPLSAVLDKCGQLPWPAAILACGQIADALASAHSRGIVHRDVTAANVLVTPAGVKLIDFGLSAWQGSAEVGSDGKLFGTPAYVAPERFDASEVHAPSDVYALGVLLYRCLSGRLPWPQLPTEQLLAAKASLAPAPLPAVAGLPNGVAHLCLRCLARDPAKRPSAAAVANDLNATYRTATASMPTLPGFGEACEPNIRLGGEACEPNIRLGGEACEPNIRLGGEACQPNTSLLGDACEPNNRLVGAACEPNIRHFASARRERTTAPFQPLPRTQAARRPAHVAFGLGLVGTLAVGGLGWAILNLPTRIDRLESSAVPPKATPRCSVTYREVADDGRHFTATIEVSQRGTADVESWRLSFTLADNQTLDAAGAPDWRQADDIVMSINAPRAPLRPGVPADLAFAGNYRGANPIPTRFTLNAQPCDVTVYGPAGTPGGEGTGRVLAGPLPSTVDQLSTVPPSDVKETGKPKVSGSDPGHQGRQNGNSNGVNGSAAAPGKS